MNRAIRYDRPVQSHIMESNEPGRIARVRHKKSSVTLHVDSLDHTHDVMQFVVDEHGHVNQYAGADEVLHVVKDEEGNIESIHVRMAAVWSNRSRVVTPPTLKAAARLIGWLFVYVVDNHYPPGRDSIHLHERWDNVPCPGEYMKSVHMTFLEEAQGWFTFFQKQKQTETTMSVVEQDPSITEHVSKIQLVFGINPANGKWDDATDRVILEYRRKYLRR